jgi:hypothetical protein
MPAIPSIAMRLVPLAAALAIGIAAAPAQGVSLSQSGNLSFACFDADAAQDLSASLRRGTISANAGHALDTGRCFTVSGGDIASRTDGAGRLGATGDTVWFVAAEGAGAGEALSRARNVKEQATAALACQREGAALEAERVMLEDNWADIQRHGIEHSSRMLMLVYYENPRRKLQRERVDLDKRIDAHNARCAGIGEMTLNAGYAAWLGARG